MGCEKYSITSGPLALGTAPIGSPARHAVVQGSGALSSAKHLIT
jgi:hypothetical protein